MAVLPRTRTPRLKIVNEGDVVGPNTKILLVERDEDDQEIITDLTTRFRVTRVVSDLSVGEASRATLECICVYDEIDALLDDLIVRHVGRSRFGRLKWSLKKWLWGVKRSPVDITPLGTTHREYLPAERS